MNGDNERFEMKTKENKGKIKYNKDELGKFQRRIDNDQLLMIWNQEIVNKSEGKFHKRPDIYIEVKIEKVGIIIDMTIVGDKKISLAFNEKMNMYKILQEKMRQINKLKAVNTIPVVISINGLINKESVRMLKENNIVIPWEIMVREIVIRNMKDLMKYCGDHGGEYRNIEEPHEEDSKESERWDVISPEQSNVELITKVLFLITCQIN